MLPLQTLSRPRVCTCGHYTAQQIHYATYRGKEGEDECGPLIILFTIFCRTRLLVELCLRKKKEESEFCYHVSTPDVTELQR